MFFVFRQQLISKCFPIRNFFQIGTQFLHSWYYAQDINFIITNADANLLVTYSNAVLKAKFILYTCLATVASERERGGRGRDGGRERES